MKITDERKKLENAQRKKEEGTILADTAKGTEENEVELSEEDLDQVAGGIRR